MYLNPNTFSPGDFNFAGLLGGSSPAGGYSTAGLGQTQALSMPGQASGAGLGSLGLNVPTAQLALSGLGAIGNIMSAWNANKLAKKQFEYQKSISDTNLANSIQSYNTSIQDRARARGAAEGQTDAQVQDYIARNSLARR